MYILLTLNFLFSCFIGVFFYNQMKEKEDEIEELYNLYYKHQEEDNIKNKKSKGRVVTFDKRIF